MWLLGQMVCDYPSTHWKVKGNILSRSIRSLANAGYLAELLPTSSILCVCNLVWQPSLSAVKQQELIRPCYTSSKALLIFVIIMELSCLYFESIILIAVSYQGSHNSLTIFLDSSNDLSHVFSPEKGSPYWSKWGHDLKNLGWDGTSYGWWKKSCSTWHVWNPVNNGRNYHFSHQQYHYHQFTTIHNVNDVVTHQLPENWTTEWPGKLKNKPLGPV